MKEREWGTDEMILTGENSSTQRKICSTATLSTTNPSWTGLRLNLGLCGERPTPVSLSHGTTFQFQLQLQNLASSIIFKAQIKAQYMRNHEMVFQT
jgi:hypothetical protein